VNDELGRISYEAVVACRKDIIPAFIWMD